MVIWRQWLIGDVTGQGWYGHPVSPRSLLTKLLVSLFIIYLIQKSYKSGLLKVFIQSI